MGLLNVSIQSAISVPDAPTGMLTLFIDSADGLLKSKDENGDVLVQGLGIANALATTGAPVDVSLGDPPNQGDVLQAQNATSARFVSPAEIGALKEVALVTGPAVYVASIGEYVPVDVASGAVSITLPSAIGQKNKLVAIKLRTNAAFSCTLNPVLGQTIDGNANLVLSINKEWAFLRSNNVNWDQVG